jgi:hypothetical protein
MSTKSFKTSTLSNGLTRGSRFTAGQFSPLSLGNAAWWLDASDQSTISLSSNKITQWTDKSGNNRNFTQSDDTKRPTYSSNTITFAQETQQHLINTSYTLTSNAFSGFVVCTQSFRGGTRNNYGRFLSLYNTSGLDYNNLNSITLTDITPAPTNYSLYRNSGAISSTSQVTLNTKFILGFTLDGTNTVLYKNQLAGINGTTSATSLNVNAVRLAADSAEADSNIAGNYYEVVAYNRALTSYEVSLLTSYLATKWSVS